MGVPDTVRLTRRHIEEALAYYMDASDEGWPLRAEQCPLAIAIKEKVGPGVKVEVEDDSVQVGDDECPLAEDGRIVVERFDALTPSSGTNTDATAIVDTILAGVRGSRTEAIVQICRDEEGDEYSDDDDWGDDEDDEDDDDGETE